MSNPTTEIATPVPVRIHVPGHGYWDALSRSFVEEVAQAMIYMSPRAAQQGAELMPDELKWMYGMVAVEVTLGEPEHEIVTEPEEAPR